MVVILSEYEVVKLKLWMGKIFKIYPGKNENALSSLYHSSYFKANFGKKLSSGKILIIASPYKDFSIHV